MAVEHLVGAYRAWASNGASSAPAWLKTIRDSGIARFSELGFPNMKQEAWRFTSIAPIAEGSFVLSHPAARIPHVEEITPLLVDVASLRLVFVNGFCQRTLSSPVFDSFRLFVLC